MEPAIQLTQFPPLIYCPGIQTLDVLNANPLYDYPAGV